MDEFKNQIIQAVKNGVITADEAIEYMQSREWKYKPYNATDAESFGYQITWDEHYSEPDSEGDPYDEPNLEELRNTANVLRQELNKVARLWRGLYKTDFKALTPDILDELNEKCKQIEAHVTELDRLHRNCEELGHDQEELDELFSVYNQVDAEIIYCIMQSWLASTGQQVTQYNPPSLQTPDDFDPAMLQLVKVEPWEMPPCPPLSVPERPAVILEVISVGDGHVRAGLDDVFNPIVMVEYLPVDEELTTGDRIIVKGSKWDSKTSLIKDPEYDGLAEPDCPLSTEDELLALKYTFDQKKEQVKLLERHKNEWVRKHWRLLTESQILKIADGGSIDDVIEFIDYEASDEWMLMKKMNFWDVGAGLKFDNEYQYENYKYNTYNNYNELNKYMNQITYPKIKERNNG